MISWRWKHQIYNSWLPCPSKTSSDIYAIQTQPKAHNSLSRGHFACLEMSGFHAQKESILKALHSGSARVKILLDSVRIQQDDISDHLPSFHQSDICRGFLSNQRSDLLIVRICLENIFRHNWLVLQSRPDIVSV